MPRQANTLPSKADRSETWMTQLRHLPWAPFVYYESSKNPEGIGSVSNNYKPSQESAFGASISSTIRAVILITIDYHVNYNCFNEPFAVSPYRSLYWDMHGLIFETTIWLLAGSTRFVDVTLSCNKYRIISRWCTTWRHHNNYQYKPQHC